MNNDRDGSLENPPSGGKVRLPDAQAKPWAALGISRASWYRQGKPSMDALLFSERGIRQKRNAKTYGCSIRSIQRQFFILEYGGKDLYLLACLGCLPRGMLEEIAKWEHENQRRFIGRLLELAPDLKRDEKYSEAAEAEFIKMSDPVVGILASIDRAQLLRAARQVRREIEADIFRSTDEELRRMAESEASEAIETRRR